MALPMSAVDATGAVVDPPTTLTTTTPTSTSTKMTVGISPPLSSSSSSSSSSLVSKDLPGRSIGARNDNNKSRQERVVTLLHEMNDFHEMKDIIPTIGGYINNGQRLLFRYPRSKQVPSSTLRPKYISEDVLTAVSPYDGASTTWPIANYVEEDGTATFNRWQDVYGIAIDGHLLYALTLQEYSTKMSHHLLIWNSRTSETKYVHIEHHLTPYLTPNLFPHQLHVGIINHNYIVMGSQQSSVTTYNPSTNKWTYPAANDASWLRSRQTAPSYSGMTQKSLITSTGLWIRVVSDDNTLHCYNIRTCVHSILPISQPSTTSTSGYHRPNHIIEIGHTGYLLIITWRPTNNIKRNGQLFQLYNPSIPLTLPFEWTDFRLPFQSLDAFNIISMNIDDEHYLCIEHQSGFAENELNFNPWWRAPIISTGGLLSSDPHPMMGEWSPFGVPHDRAPLTFPPEFVGVIE
jgi:hypothetical protein